MITLPMECILMKGKFEDANFPNSKATVEFTKFKNYHVSGSYGMKCTTDNVLTFIILVEYTFT